MSKVYVSARLPTILMDAVERHRASMPNSPWGKAPNRTDAIIDLLSDSLKAKGHLKEPKRRRR